MNAERVAKIVREYVDEYGTVDVGFGVEKHFGVSRSVFNAAIQILVECGYQHENVEFTQLETGATTIIRILSIHGKTQREIWEMRHGLQQI